MEPSHYLRHFGKICHIVLIKFPKLNYHIFHIRKEAEDFVIWHRNNGNEAAIVDSHYALGMESLPKEKFLEGLPIETFNNFYWGKDKSNEKKTI